MAEKNRKLRDQFETDASTSSADGRGIFRGISIFVDGFTIPSSQMQMEMEMQAMEEEEREMRSSSNSNSNNSVICLFTNPEGEPLGTPLYLPQKSGPPQLQEIVNKLLNNDEKLPYAFYISDQELVVELGSYLQKNKVSVEKVLRIVYQPQAIFRIRPVNRCSATIAGMAILKLCFLFPSVLTDETWPVVLVTPQ